jgi:hypothetical protein
MHKLIRGTEEEHIASLQRCFNHKGPDTYIHMDGDIARNQYLKEGWNYALEQGWIKAETVESEQDTYLKGYLTEKGRKELNIQ